MGSGKNAGRSRTINSSSKQQTVIQERILSTVGMKRESDAKYVVSYGDGINSTAMIVYLVKNNLPLDYVVFSDAGDEELILKPYNTSKMTQC